MPPKKPVTPQTTAQQLGAIIKSARNIMRKDKGLNGDLDRLPMLTWIMFLKFLDDMEHLRETNAALAGTPFRPDIAPPYRWRDWGADAGGITGAELIAFVNNDEAMRPNGTRGAGLFYYLRGLRSVDGADRRDVIATVFKGMQNRMADGYLLRDVITLVDGIHFTASAEMHTLSRLYETLLREMRDAAGDSGEFYTPRPAVRFMVQVMDPRLGETVLDPACGTGGFLVESFVHLQQQCRSVADLATLQETSIRGGEAKSLPYLLAQMNLLLHGLNYPRIDPGNSLRVPLRDLTDQDRVDLILTNVPFGGEEDRGILSNFPKDRQTAETALLFLQLIMRRLKRPGPGNDRGGRAGVIVPNGTLFGDGVCARVKEDLLKHYHVHTIVRLPEGVFAPYTDIPSNLIFFDRSGPTETIWYYRVPLPAGRRKFTKTKPMEDADLAACLAWWVDRKEGADAWRVNVADVLKYDAEGRLLSVNLDIKNPHGLEALEHREPLELLDDMLRKERRVNDLLAEIRTLIDRTAA
ncbi:class I SAM-dependent DNA methyltransferase [uncultured Lamprocystis sp.]|jgi:type I restriction enzyme M protein|uniref:class I SAM-dependent DNA methyltransferase n=1 Tax=uncultured Lamprocystis sp. TaxID=543132 RepID=UPI0025DD66E3|nr:class I SAM-dependent DNA methyltransferase [uncultured Lamprocystis sp.]